jgi:hypothetical integral membrane protein (TIGR02206 family)
MLFATLDPMMEYTVKTFSPMWWQTSGMTIIVTVLILIGLRFLNQKQQDLYAKGLGWLLVLWTIIPPIAHVLMGQWHIRYGLPLQMCDSTGFIAGIAVLTRKQLLYEITLCWALTGATMALLTPQFTQGISWVFLTEFFVSHSILVTAPFFLSIYGGMRPRSWAWLRSFGWLNVLAFFVGIFNYMVNANYMFLCKAPTAKNPLIQGAWPTYLIGFEIACLLLFLLIYAPFYVLKLKENKITG